MTKPFVSVLIDTYNHEKFIEQAVRSVLEQDFPASEREILVVDDGSTDRTPEILKKFEPQIRVLRKKNGGQASAFNVGIPECRGEIVAFLDGDDWWAQEKLSRVAPMLAEAPELAMVGHGSRMMHSDGREITEVLRTGLRFSLQNRKGAELFLTRKGFLGTRSTIRTSALRKLLPVPESIRIEADEFVFTMAAAQGEVEIVPEALFFYRLHADNFYSQHGFLEARIRKKQESIAELARRLEERLPGIGTRAEVVRLVVNWIRVEADQLRLSLGAGKPWETVRTELAIYAAYHSDAPWSHRAFKYAMLAPAYIVPPRFYYAVRRRLAASRLYLKARKVIFPAPQPTHVGRTREQVL